MSLRFHISKALSGQQGNMELQLDAEIEAGKVTAIFGPSGAGKTTLLRILAGLTEAEQGKIEWGDKLWLNTASAFSLRPQERAVGFVFQDYALFPNMSVRGNIEFAAAGMSQPELVEELLEIAQLTALQARKPSTLSGGQQQRVALARAIARRPSLLLLDEPLAAIDTAMRQQLQDIVLQMHRRFDLTTLWVSHDAGEIFRTADKVMKLEDGKLVALDTPEKVFGGSKLSGKFQVVGEVVRIEQKSVVTVVQILAGNQLVKTVSSPQEVEEMRLKVGDRVMLASKAFNPVMVKLDK